MAKNIMGIIRGNSNLIIIKKKQNDKICDDIRGTALYISYITVFPQNLRRLRSTKFLLE